MKTIHSKTIVFITGAFVSNRGWDNWKAYFESKGYKTLAPAWPLKDGVPATLRAQHPDSPIAALSLEEVVEHYAAIIRALPEKPILIGHSLGGLMTQLLLQKDIAAAGIAIHSVPPQGVLSFKFSFLKATFRPFGFFTSLSKTHLMSFKEWQYAFTNGMTLEEQQASYHASVIPESKRALRGALGSTGKIDFSKPHVPLLFVAGDQDNIMPASLNYSNYMRYKKYSSVTDYKEFKGRNHYVLELPTWKENADYILDWIETH
jgi:pimeloyl-ACP methyl ester carboxylesterase